MVDELKKKGLSESEIAKGMGLSSTTELRQLKSNAKTAVKSAQADMAARLREKGYSHQAIAERMGLAGESSVRALLKPSAKRKSDVLEATSSMLRSEVEKKGYIDVGVNVERHLGISQVKLSNSVKQLTDEGYTLHNVYIDQFGNGQKKTKVKVLAAPGVDYKTVLKNQGKIQQIGSFSTDGGLTYPPQEPPLSISSKRVAVRYGSEGGAEADGVIFVRPGVDDVSLGGSNYAQVRVSVDGSHYLKGMAMYRDDLPKGVDLMFNTNKENTGNKLDAMKPLKDDPDLPFGAVTRPLTRPEAGGKERPYSVMNIVNAEKDWDGWNRNLSSQMLSKQPVSLAKQQLDRTYKQQREELDLILSNTNPVVKKKLLQSFSDGADSAAVHLKAAAMPRQRTQVILPVNSLKETEIYAPNFDNGENVVLIRYPHGGIFEIPQLKVNNRHPEARKLLGNATDAVGINSRVAERLSGADFDGDTVLVIPNPGGRIKTAPALEGLKGFDPKAAFPAYEGMPKMTAKQKGMEMGLVSNLITDMTIKGANNTELAAAVRHSMVVIDAEKHHLNYRQSAIDNGIPALKKKYQNRKGGGASTLISQSGKATSDVNARTARKAANGGPIDKATGKKVYEETGESYVDSRTGKLVIRTQKVSRLGDVEDAHTLSSGKMIETVYANHSNRMKALANEARKEMVNTEPTPYSPSAKAAYAEEVKKLNSDLDLALRNSPLERQALILANAVVKRKLDSNPDLEKSDIKKIKSQALKTARLRVGAHKTLVEITDRQWEAIQAGAISSHQLSQILDNTDLDRIKELSMPRKKTGLSASKVGRAQTMLQSGKYTRSEIAKALGVSIDALNEALGGE